MKKIVCLLFAVTMLVTCMIPTAFAAGSATVSMTSASAKRGEAVTLTVSVSGNTNGLYSYGFQVKYDSNALELVSAGGGSLSSPSSANNKVGWFCTTPDPVTGDGSLFTMTFQVKDSASKGTYDITLVTDDFTDGNWDSYSVNTVPGQITVNVPHRHGVEFMPVEEKAATCTETGNKYYYRCSCGEVGSSSPTFSDYQPVEKFTIPALGHKWGEWKVTKEPSCAVGEKERVCERCGEKETEVIPADGSHKWGEWKVTTPATCEKKGTQTRSCSICGESQSQTNIPALGHDFESWVKLDDNSHTHTCKRSGCGKTETAAHTWEKIDHKDPNCRDDGYDRFRCPDCEAVKTQVLKSTGEHGFNTWTDNKDGKTHHSICDGCGVEKKTEDHTWDKEEITKQPTCSAKGEKTYTCKCGAVKTEEIPATGEHTYSNGKWEKNDAETHKMKCDHCDNYKTAKHNWDKGVVTEKPTCSKEGTKVFTCKDCKETRTEKLPATGKHDYTDKYEKVDGKTHKAFCDCGESIVEEHKKSTFIKVIQKPTSSTKGLELWACACGYEMEVETPAISGNYDNVPKTGDITGQIILAGFCVVAVLSGTVYGIKRKITR